MKRQYEESAKTCIILVVVCVVLALILNYAGDSIKSEWTYILDEDAQTRYKACDVLMKLVIVVAVAGAIAAVYNIFKAKESEWTVNLVACPDCGKMLSRQAKMCPRCGRGLEQPVTTATSPTSTLRDRTEVHRVQTSVATAEGIERKTVQPVSSGNMIICPVCGTVQRKDRTCCFKCSAGFLEENEVDEV